MKILITIAMLLMLSVGTRAQSVREPTKGDFKLFCDEISLAPKGPTGFKAKTSFQYNYEYELWVIAGVDPNIDTIDTARFKIQKFWNKYKYKFICNDTGFRVFYGGLMKYSVHLNFKDLIETLIMSYNLDINFLDIEDGKNVLDFIDDEIKRLGTIGTDTRNYIRQLKDFRDTLIMFGAKNGAEVRREEKWTAEDHFKAAISLKSDWGATDNQYYQAAYHFNKAIEINPKYTDAYVALARLLLTDSENSATTELTAALELNPNSIEAYKLRATSFCRLGKKAEAAADEKKVIELGGKVEQKCQ
jgi:tetratricopeptide (TPR) repeat protein